RLRCATTSPATSSAVRPWAKASPRSRARASSAPTPSWAMIMPTAWWIVSWSAASPLSHGVLPRYSCSSSCGRAISATVITPATRRATPSWPSVSPPGAVDGPDPGGAGLLGEDGPGVRAAGGLQVADEDRCPRPQDPLAGSVAQRGLELGQVGGPGAAGAELDRHAVGAQRHAGAVH